MTKDNQKPEKKMPKPPTTSNLRSILENKLLIIGNVQKQKKD